ncbi:ABC transporter permease subunit [Treponema phagedenis]|uniref:ABC transporter permease n=1 Tax=Treponema phagedenis TaxID=162 RepID=A0AAE6M770_TREPH|nr:ABC transporter permease [Treponema phagedenis]QEJ97139.1 ABC transporter permease [Treponema phagedenis]QEK02671.1 ABC transporter permease [Treponema phagedenis]QEK08298.1 ABC transporter permease [Treponema phagedenis]
MNVIISILQISTPLIFASLGALSTEYAGVLAVFMEGAISLSAFLFVLFTVFFGNYWLGFLCSLLAILLLLFAFAFFTEKKQANPFLTGLSFNLFAAGITTQASARGLGVNGVIAFSQFDSSKHIPLLNNSVPAAIALVFALLFYLFLRCTKVGLNLRFSGEGGKVLEARGAAPSAYKIGSWLIAGFFAACAGASLVLKLGAFTPNISSGRGWTALAVVFLSYKHPLLCVPAALLFSAAEYSANILQTLKFISPSMILALPYLAALTAFILPAIIKKDFVGFSRIRNKA